jgi:hypothetical protein
MADRVLVHVDTEQAGEKLVNRRLVAYVAVSRGRYDAQLYPNDAAKLSEALSRDVSKHSALEVEVSRIHVQGQQLGVKQPNASNVPKGNKWGGEWRMDKASDREGDLRGNPSPDTELRRLSPTGSC